MATTSFQFLDVGMGDGTLIITPNKRIMLVDFGELRTPFQDPPEDALTYLLKTIGQASSDRGLQKPTIDHLFITHGDEDHYNKILGLVNSTNFKHFPGKTAEIRRLTFGGEATDYGTLITDLTPKVTGTVDNLGDHFVELPDQNGDVNSTWQIDNVDIYLLCSNYPYKNSAKKNPKSLVLMFEYAGDKVIISGDAEWQVEADIINSFKNAKNKKFLEVFAIKVGHHGSRNAASQAWLDATKPSVAFASGDMVWAHPYCETITRIVDNGSLENIAEHYYCCGQGHNDTREYFNNKTKKGVCLNLWYVVKKASEDLKLPSKKFAKSYDRGYTFGVQWACDLHDNKQPEVYSTEGPRPGAFLADEPGAVPMIARPQSSAQPDRRVIQLGLV
jgi:beta-lactamase superfamily II metal-dependent hydrolase